MSYTTPNKTHYTVDEQKARLPLYLQEFYQARQLDRIKIDGNEIQGYFEYSFIEEKTFTKSPERTASGVIGNLNSYTCFFTPRLVIKYNYMHISDYRQLMTLLNSKNEFTVECYDIVKDKRVVHKMYHATPEMPSIHQRYLEVLGVKDYTVELIGTNADIEKASVIYYLNAPVGYASDNALPYYEENDLYVGEDIIVGDAATEIVNETFGGRLRFNGWNIASYAPMDEKTLGNYINGSTTTIQSKDGLSLYAQWQETTVHRLVFNYGVAEHDIKHGALDYWMYNEVTEGSPIGDLPRIIPPTVTYTDENGNQQTETPYISGQWCKIQGQTSTSVSSSTLYWSNRSSMLYAYLRPKEYTISFYIAFEDGHFPTVATSTEKHIYNSSVSYIQPTKVIDGTIYKIMYWYYDKNFKKPFNNGSKMPPYNLNLYGKWSKTS